LANIDRVFIEVPVKEGTGMEVTSVKDASDEQFDWWVQSWIKAGRMELEYNLDRCWLRNERSDLIDWMRSVDIPIIEAPLGTLEGD
jgi:hypothetical protein